MYFLLFSTVQFQDYNHATFALHHVKFMLLIKYDTPINYIMMQ